MLAIASSVMNYIPNKDRLCQHLCKYALSDLAAIKRKISLLNTSVALLSDESVI